VDTSRQSSEVRERVRPIQKPERHILVSDVVGQRGARSVQRLVSRDIQHRAEMSGKPSRKAQPACNAAISAADNAPL